MKSLRKTVIILLLILNVLVLMGLLWPAAAPPFAHTVNLVFLISSLVYFALAARK